MGQNTSIINFVGNVANPASTSQPDGATPLFTSDRQSALLVSETHGKFYTSAYRKNMFHANRTAVTIPVVASGLVSVFTLYNPQNSGVIGELVDTELSIVLATTVVDAVGWYASFGSVADAGTFTTIGVPNTNLFSARIGDTPGNLIKFYSAYTHSGTPARVDIIGGFGATADATSQLPVKIYDGRLLIPPGVAMSVAMSTAAGTASGLDISARWAEWLI